MSKPNLTVLLLDAPFSSEREDERQLQENVNFKHACIPIGSAIFNRIWGAQQN
jgi:hypothetical protein